jgi:WD40 repeat protein
MVSNLFFNAHHPFSVHVFPLRLLWLYFLALIFTNAIPAQGITGLEIVRTLEHDNYSVSALGCYFEDGHQLIAYSNNSGGGGGDTLVIYDFAQDMVISEVPGTTWSYDIRFIDESQLLFKNGYSLYRLVNISAPVVNELLMSVYTFTLSPDKEAIAILRYVLNEYRVEVSSYNSSTGSLGTPDIYPIPDEINFQDAKLSYSPDGNYVALNGGYENDYVYLISTLTGDATKVNTPENAGTYSPVFYDQEGTLRLAVGGGYLNGNIEVIEVQSLMLEASIPVFPSYNYTLAVDQTNEYLVTGGYDGIIKLFHVDGPDFMEIDMYPTGLIDQLIFTQDGAHVLAGIGQSNGSRLEIYRVLREPSRISSLETNPLLLYPNPTNGLLYLEGMEAAVISVYDLHGRQVIRNRTCGSLIDVRALPDGLYLIKTEDEKEVRAAKFNKN